MQWMYDGEKHIHRFLILNPGNESYWINSVIENARFGWSKGWERSNICVYPSMRSE